MLESDVVGQSPASFVSKEENMAKTEAYKGLFAMHKYWGKKPFEVIDRFIERYSKKDEVVLDSFCGSGVTLIEALRTGRKAIGIDINPIAVKLAKASLEDSDNDKLLACFKEIERKARPTIDSLYERTKGKEKQKTTHVLWEGEEPVEIRYIDEQGKKGVRKADSIDKRMAMKPKIAPKWYPKTQLIENARINVTGRVRVSDLFTKRALVALSYLLEAIEEVQDESLRDALELTFTGCLSQASNLVFAIRRKEKGKTRIEVGSWVIGYWVPKEHFELNVWNCFENRFERILKGKKEVHSFYTKEDSSFSMDRVSLHVASATQLDLPDDAIDYAFIDPPHVNRILYVEQSLMWNAWLKLDKDIDWKDEIVVSEAKKRKKDRKDYLKLLRESFLEISRTLKKGRNLSVVFNCLEDGTWVEVLDLLADTGFAFLSIEPLEYSATSVVQDSRANALKNDFVITFVNDRKKGRRVVLEKDPAILEKYFENLEPEEKTGPFYKVMTALYLKTIPQGFLFKVSDIAAICAKMKK